MALLMPVSEKFVDMFLMSGSLAIQADEGIGKLHLRLLAMQADGFLNPGVTVEPVRRVGTNNRFPTT